MNKFFLFTGLILILQTSSSIAQNKRSGGLFSAQNDSTKKTRFIILPAFGYTQETGFQYGLTSLTTFNTGPDTLTRNSSISAIAALTSKKQSIFTVKPDIWSVENKYHYLGELKYKDFPIDFYGIGSNTKEADEERIDQKLIRVAAEVEKKMREGSYTGVNLSYEDYQFADKEAGGLYETSPFIRDKDGGQVLFMGLSQIIDSRNSNIYPTAGTYIKLNYSYAPDFFGGANYTGSQLKLNFKTFKSYNPKTVVGINVAYQGLPGNNVPFYLLPQLGNDEIMRGYYTGRYRDRNLLAAQAELRYRPIQRIGFVAFAGAGSTYTKLNLNYVKPSYGAGFRYFFDTIKGLSMRMDYAFGEKRSGEKRQQGFYLALGEAF